MLVWWAHRKDRNKSRLRSERRMRIDSTGTRINDSRKNSMCGASGATLVAKPPYYDSLSLIFGVSTIRISRRLSK